MTASIELELQIALLRDGLETAKHAVAVAQLQVDKERANRQAEAEGAEARRDQRIQKLIAAAGVGVAASQLVSEAVATELLQWVRLAPADSVVTDHSALLLLLIRVLVTFVLMLIAWKVTKRLIARYQPAVASTGQAAKRE